MFLTYFMHTRTKVTVRLAASGEKMTHITRTMVVPKARDLSL